MISRYESDQLEPLYIQLAKKDGDLQRIIDEYGFPPSWTRPNSFETLVLIILEQQVSLASAYAAYKKLKQRIPLRPDRLLQLSDEELKSCYLSRQKIVYVRRLADAIVQNQLDLGQLEDASDEMVREKLKQLKGIGDWTVDIFLIHALRRIDVFPVGDLALVNAIRMIRQMPGATKEELLQISEEWKPYRSLATMLFWHYYIKKKNIRILH